MAASLATFWGPRAKIGAYYFLQFASISLVMPYWNLMFRRAGLSEDHIGVIAALRPWVSAPASVLLAALADRLLIHRSMFFALSILGTLLRSAILLPLPGPFWGILTVMMAMEVVCAPNGVLTTAAIVASLPDSRDYGRLRAWGAVGWGIFSLVGGAVIARWGIFVAFAMFWAASAMALGWAAVAIPFNLEAPQDAPTHAAEKAGGLGLELELSEAGAAAEGDMKPVATGGQANAGKEAQGEESGEEKEEGDEEAASLLATATEGARESGQRSKESGRGRDVGTGTEAGAGASSTSGRGPDAPALSKWQQLRELICQPEVVLFLSLALTMGTAVGVIDGYLFLFLEELGSHETLMGATLTFTCISEVPIFFFSKAIINRLGADGTLHLVVACFLLRLAAYSTLAYWPAPWMVLPVELLHGITFGCAWAAGTHKCAEVAPDGLGATVQGLFQSMYFGYGRGLGALVGGFLYKVHGAMVMYRVAFAWVSLGWAVNVAARFLRQRWLRTGRSAYVEI